MLFASGIPPSTGESHRDLLKQFQFQPLADTTVVFRSHGLNFIAVQQRRIQVVKIDVTSVDENIVVFDIFTILFGMFTFINTLVALS